MTSETPSSDRAVVLYDGHCEFCRAQARRLAGGSERIALKSFHDEGVIDAYPPLTIEDCMQELKLIVGGRIFGGAEAVVRAAAIRSRLGRLLFVYYVPGIRSLANAIYRWVASRRYAIAGKRIEDCDTGTCHRHGP